MTLSDWKQSPITEVIFTELRRRIEALRAELGDSAGVSPLDDRYKVGYIQGLKDFLDIEMADLDEESHD